MMVKCTDKAEKIALDALIDPPGYVTLSHNSCSGMTKA